MILRNGQTFLFAPTHSVDAIYCFIERGFRRVLASNSMALIVAACPEAMFPPEQTEVMHARANGILSGYVRYPRRLYENDYGTMRRLAWGLFQLDFLGHELRELPPFPDEPAPFSDYVSYGDYLRRIISDILANANDRARQQPYDRLITSISAGYDSPACAALAKPLGCRQAITLTTARGGRKDSGVEVAAALELQCIELDRDATRLESTTEGFLDPAHFTDERYAEFMAGIVTANDLVLAPFAEHIAGSVFLTGFHGDKIWALECPSGPEIVRGDNSGSGLDEFRKRVGFVHLPVPFIGAQHYETIKAITHSPDMASYRVPGLYDRPIARRMAEEMGVPRSAFGQIKMAGVIHTRRSLDLIREAFLAHVGKYRQALTT